MRKWLLVGSLCLAACSARTPEGAESAESAIVGGESASQYPEAVLINMPHGTCSGALVAPRVVLTAAHCIVGHGGWTVYAPYADEQYSDANASDVFDYSAVGAVLDPSHHDVGLLYLDHAIRWPDTPPSRARRSRTASRWCPSGASSTATFQPTNCSWGRRSP